MKGIRFVVLFLSTCLATMTLAPFATAQPGPQGPMTLAARPIITHMDRTVIGADIAHYIYDMRIGAGEFDRIRIHRVVREAFPGHAVRTLNALYMVHGDNNKFEMIFMAPQISQVPAWDHSLPAYLAEHNIDVWGMDQDWALVPPGTTDFSFFKNWNLQREVNNIETGLSLARSIRMATGQGVDQLELLGFSSGAITAYVVANEETRWPRYLRNVKGIIPVDWAIKYAPGEEPQGYCKISYYQGLLDSGTYADDASVINQFGALAISAPSDPSPFFDGLSNYQGLLAVGASGTPHFVAGIFDSSGMPTGLRYTEPRVFADVLVAASDYMPVHWLLDENKVVCNAVTPPYDDHLKDVTIPILYVGAAGGTGTSGYYAPTLTGSRDVSQFNVQLMPNDASPLDFGHADLFLARNAERLVWKPILNWLVAHR
jgi:hypothetical protein